MSEAKDYRWFVRHFAPLGYAHLYRRAGDFHAAQKALEQVVKDGYTTWANTRPDGLPNFGARLMAGMAVAHPLEEPPSAALQSSFARSRKLAAVQEAIGVLLEAKDNEAIALFLMYVEEVPEDRLLEWLGIDEAHVEMLRERMRRRVASIAVPVTEGEDAYGFFQRTLRQYRLPATMFDRVQNTVQKQERVGATVEGRAALAVVGLVMLLTLVMCMGNANRFFSTSRSGPYRSSHVPAGFPILVDLVLSIASLLTGSALTATRRTTAGILMIVGGGVGVMMLFIGVLGQMEGARGDFAEFFAFMRHLWLLVMMTMMAVIAYQAVRERGRAEAKA